MKYILSSSSPRRKELLKRVIDDFEIIEPDVDEEKIKENDPIKYAVTAATLKAKSVGEKRSGCIVLAADTIVSYKGKIIGKPKIIKKR